MRVSRLLPAFVAIAASLVLAAPRADANGATSVTSKIHLTMPPANAPCPKTLSFRGTFTLGGVSYKRALVAIYTWIRSDGATGPTMRVHLARGTNVIPVSETWEIGKNYSGWEALQVQYPLAYTSHHHNFTLTCP